MGRTAVSAQLQFQGSAAWPTRRRAIAGLLAPPARFSPAVRKLPSICPRRRRSQHTDAAGATIGAGQVKAALILPLSAAGNAGVAGQAMRNAAEMAIAEFNAPNIQLLVKDDGGTAEAARLGAQQALDEGAEIILGPLFAQSVSFVGQVARPRNVPVIAFSTDANVASSGVYLLSFLPEIRRRSHRAICGLDREALLRRSHPRQSLWHCGRGGLQAGGGAARRRQIVALERYPHDKTAMANPVRSVGQASARADALFIPDGGDAVPDVAQALVADGVNLKRLQLLGTGLWDDPRIYSAPGLDGGWYAAPDGVGYRNFRHATAPATTRIRCAPPPWRMTRSRWLRLW